MSRRAVSAIGREIEFVSYPRHPEPTRDIKGRRHSRCEARHRRGVWQGRRGQDLNGGAFGDVRRP